MSENQAKKQKFQIFLFLVGCFLLLIYICAVAMVRQLMNEENDHEKEKIYRHDAVSASGVM